jgi:hypothetical protein
MDSTLAFLYAFIFLLPFLIWYSRVDILLFDRGLLSIVAYTKYIFSFFRFRCRFFTSWKLQVFLYRRGSLHIWVVFIIRYFCFVFQVYMSKSAIVTLMQIVIIDFSAVKHNRTASWYSFNLSSYRRTQDNRLHHPIIIIFIFIVIVIIATFSRFWF